MFLLQGALAYALDVVGDLPPGALGRPTPCPGWNVRMLIAHLLTGLGVLGGPHPTGRPGPAPGPAPGDLVATLLDTACLLLTRPPSRSDGAGVAAATAAIEVAVHAWDLACACGADRPVPALIATDLLVLAPRLVPAALRPRLFAEPVHVPGGAAAGDRLVAFLGRRPGRCG